MSLTLFDGLRALPPFDPDMEAAGHPEAVVWLRRSVAVADALVIACPEYAHGIPGAFKNALDWLVSGDEFPGKPVALFHATDRSRHGRDALTEVLRTMSGILLPGLTLPLLGKTPEGIASTLQAPEARAALRGALSEIAAAVQALSCADTASGAGPHLSSMS